VQLERRVAELEVAVDDAERRSSRLERELEEKQERLRRLGGR
jgi:chaperonin cofactor prefoldin